MQVNWKGHFEQWKFLKLLSRLLASALHLCQDFFGYHGMFFGRMLEIWCLWDCWNALEDEKSRTCHLWGPASLNDPCQIGIQCQPICLRTSCHIEQIWRISINFNQYDLTWSNHARSTSWHSPRLESRGHCATWHVRVHSVQSCDTMTGMNPAKRIKEDQRGILLVEHGRTATFGHSPREECNLSEMIGYLARRSDVAFA